MSNLALNWAWKVHGISSTAKFVLVALADRANQSNKAWPSIGDIEDRTGLSERAVQKALRQLVRAGLIQIEGRRSRTNIYWLKLDAGGAPDAPHTPHEVHPNP